MTVTACAGRLVRRVGWRGVGAAILGAGALTGATLLLDGSSAVGAPTCTINFNKVAGGDFFTAANWNDAITPTTHRVPGTTDYACVPVGTTGAVTFSTGSSKTIKGIDAEGTGGLTASSGTLTVTDAANDTTIKNLNLSGATIAGAGAVNVTGSSSWAGGTVSGTGAITVPSGATFSVTSSSCYPLLSKALTNHGTILISDGGCSGLWMSSSKTLTNASDGTLDFQADSASVNNFDSSAVSIANSGTIKKSVGGGTTLLNVPVANSGALVSYQALTGTISMGTSTNSATIGGSGNLDLGTTFTVTGATTISSGPSVQISGTTVDGAANLTFNGMVAWNYGTFQGAGNTTVASGATVTIANANCYPVLLRALTNHGTITVKNGGCGQFYVGGSATITNAADGVIDLQDDNTSIGNWDSTSPGIANSGVVKRSSGSGTATIDIPITSTSTNGLQAQAGTLSLGAGGTISGTTSASAAATLSFDNTTFAVNGATFGGAGTTRFQNATANLSGTAIVNSVFEFDGATIDGDNLALNGGGTWDYGTMQGTGTTTIAAGTTLSLSAVSCYPVALRPITNHGTLAVANGGCSGFYLGNAMTLTNAADGVIDLQDDGANISNWDGTLPSISNAGVIKKSAGVGVSTIGSLLASTSTNGLQAKAGTLQISTDSTISGSTSASAGAILSLDSYTVTVNGATFAGAGTTRLQGGTANLTGATTVSSPVEIDGTLIDGAGDLALNGGGTWNYGTMQGTGTTTIGAGSNLAVPSSSCYPVVMRPFTNHGTITIANAGCTGLFVGNTAAITNASDGVIDLQGTSSIATYDATPATISNAGVIKHSSGNVTVSIQNPISVTNTASGELRSDVGTFGVDVLTNVSANTLTGGKYTVTGSATLQLPFTGSGKLVTNAATISLQGVSTKLSSPLLANALVSLASNSGSLSITNGRLLSTNAASFANSGTVIVGDGVTASTLTVGGPYTQSAGTTTVTGSSTLTPTASTVTISGGTLNGSGTVSRPLATSGTGTVQNADAAGPLTLASGYSGTGKLKTAITSVSAFDRVNVTGTATLTGSTLALSTDAAYVPATGQTFTIVSCTTACTGPFSSVTGATMPDGAFYTVTYNATSVVLTVVRNADVSITNTDSADPIKADATTGPDSLLTYTVTVANAGPGPANNVSVTDTLPHHAVATTVPGSCTGAADVKTCTLGTIPSAGNIVLTFVVRPESPETITNTASSTSTTPDPNSANNTNIAQSTVVTAQKNTSYVNVDDGAGGVSYDKPALALKQGNKVQFNFFGTASHRLLSDEGIIDSGVKATGTEFAVAITGSGVYSYHDTLAAQVVTGKITVKPTFTGSGSTRTVTWASAAPPAGWVFDVKVKTPTGLVTLFTGTTTTSTSFTATQGPGKYQFQVRLRRTSDNAATAYGKSAQFTV